MRAAAEGESLPSQTRGRGGRRGARRGAGEDGRPTHPHCRTACHCSRPSCRRHARRRPGHSIAGAHRPRAPPEESPSDGAVSGAFPALRGRRPAASRPCAPVGRGARSPPGTPDGSGWGRGRPPLLESASSAGGRRAAESPRPGAAQRLASPPPPGPHPPAPLPRGGRCAARVAGAPRTARPSRHPRAPAAPPGMGAAATCCGCPDRAATRGPAQRARGRTFVSARRLLSPPSVNHSWSPGAGGRTAARGLLKRQRSFSGLGRRPPRRPARPPRPLRARERALGGRLLLFFYALGPQFVR